MQLNKVDTCKFVFFYNNFGFNNVITSGVYDTFLESQVRYHCPVICILKFNKCLPKSYKRRVWNYDKADFNLFRNLLSNVDWNCIIDENDIDKSVEKFTSVHIQTAEKSIPNKIATIRPNEYPWINGLIRKLIRKRKRLYRRANELTYNRYGKILGKLEIL